MLQTRHVLHSTNQPFTDSLRSERGSSCFSGSEDCSGLNMVWFTNNAEFLVHSNQIGSSMVMGMILLMNPYVEASLYFMSTAGMYACTSGSDPVWYYSSLSRYLWGDWSSVASHDLYLRRSFHRSISDYLTMVYSSGAGFVKEGRRSHRRDSFSTTVMYVDAICAFWWM